MEAGAGALFSWAPPPPLPPPLVNLFNLLHYHGLLLLDKETKQKPANLSRDYGDRFLAADGFAQTHPEHKYLIVEGLRELGYRVGMTGNGVNDSPALKVVPTWPGLSTIVDGILGLDAFVVVSASSSPTVLPLHCSLCRSPSVCLPPQ